MIGSSEKALDFFDDRGQLVVSIICFLFFSLMGLDGHSFHLATLENVEKAQSPKLISVTGKIFCKMPGFRFYRLCHLCHKHSVRLCPVVKVFIHNIWINGYGHVSIKLHLENRWWTGFGQWIQSAHSCFIPFSSWTSVSNCQGETPCYGRKIKVPLVKSL